MKKNITVSFIFILSCVSTLLSQTSTGFETLDYLYSISGKKTLAGQHDRNDWFAMRQITGDYPALWGEDFMYYPPSGASTMAQWRQEITNDAKQHWLQGAVIALMFHACPPTSTSQTCNWWANNQGTCNGCIHSSLTNQQWTDLLTDGSSLNNAWKSRLDEIYPYLKQLQDAGVEVLFRLFHEMNQGFFWWAGQGVKSANLYKLSHDYLVKTKGLTNLIWVWNLQDFGTLANDLNTYDPGPDYWDMLALDVYWSDGTGFTSTKYNLIKNKANGKPIAIGECQDLPSIGTLQSQPLWTYFMGWSNLVQQNNSNATINSIYNASNVLTLKNGRSPLVSDDQDALTVCNFGNVFPYIAPSSAKLTLDIADAPAGSPASGKMGVLGVPANNQGEILTIYLNEPVDPRNYVGISFLAQANNASPYFVIKLEQSSDANNANQIQDWTTHPEYTGNGEWQEVQIPFDVLLGTTGTDQLGYKLNQNPDFPVSYDKLVIAPAAYQSIPAFTINIDDIRFCTSWDESGIPLMKAASFIIASVNGTVTAKAANGDPVSLKVYSVSGQEIVTGMNQVQIGAKGVYIVKATAGNVTEVQKIVVQ